MGLGEPRSCKPRGETRKKKGSRKIKKPRRDLTMNCKLEDIAIESIQNAVEREKRLKKKNSVLSCGSKSSGLVNVELESQKRKKDWGGHKNS